MAQADLLTNQQYIPAKYMCLHSKHSRIGLSLCKKRVIWHQMTFLQFGAKLAKDNFKGFILEI